MLGLTVFLLSRGNSASLEFHGFRSEITYNDNGEIEKEDVIYTDGTGSVVFNDNGTFTWKDDRSEYGDIVFEWLSTKK